MAAQRGPTPAKVPWRQIEVPLTNLHLDLQNYRHEEVPSETAAIAYLYNHEKVEALARDIARESALSPLELVGVVPMLGNPDHYVVVEGNRRLCALLLLNDPNRAPTPEARTAMRLLAKQFRLPARLSVVRFDSKASAKHWIDLRHLGVQDGQGPKTWSPTQKDRAADAGGPNKLAVALLDRARDGQWLPAGSQPAVTTLTRYLKNQEVRAALGLAHHRDLKFSHDQAEVDAALQQFLRDALPTGSKALPLVHSRTKDEDRRAYARELRVRNVSPRTPLTAPVTPAAAKPAVGSTGGKGRNRPDPALRKFLVPSGFVCNVNDNNLRMLFREMQRTEIDGHEFANAYLLRAFVERIATLYLKKVEPGFNPPDDQSLVHRCSQNLDPTMKNRAFKLIRVAGSNKDASHSLDTLSTVVHINGLHNRRELVTAWANWEFALRAMLAEILKP